MSTDELLAERGKTHGDYREHAACTQDTLALWQTQRNWGRLSKCQKETLHMLAHKVGRVLTGDPNVKDHWDDMAGYTRLISKEIERGPLSRTYSDEGPVTYVPHAVSLTNTDTEVDQYRRYCEANRRSVPLPFETWRLRQHYAEHPMVPREDSNRHAFQEPDNDGA